MKPSSLYLSDGSKTARSGFSAIELILVVVVLSILVLVINQKFAGLSRQKNLMSARSLASDLRYARNMAVQRESNVKVVFSVALNQYAVYVGDTNENYTLLKDPLTRQDWITKVDGKYSEARISGVNIGGQSTLLYSCSNGVPCDGNALPLSAGGTVTFVNGTVITVSPGTGYISVSE